jgi:hypothetical protein
MGTELQIGQFRVLLHDSDVHRTETILAQPLPGQIECYHWRGGAGPGHECTWNVTVVRQTSRTSGLPTRGIMPETLGEDEAIEATRSR